MADFKGTNSSDTIVGSNVRDFISGLPGDDLIFGYGDGSGVGGTPPAIDPAGGGAVDGDVLSGDEGADTIRGGGGGDNLSGGADNDSLSGDDGSDFVLGGDGADVLDGGAGDDVLDGTDGVGEESDRLTGAGGNDTFVLRAFLVASSLADFDTITDFEDGGDVIMLSGGSLIAFDGLQGFSPTVGSALPFGGDGFIDVAYSFDGTDTWLAADVDDNGKLNDGDLLVRLNGNVTLTKEDFVGGTFDAYRLDDGPNLFIGTADSEWVYGQGGDDTLIGGGGFDALHGGLGNDSLSGGIGLFGDEGDDTLVGGDAAEELRGGEGADLLDGGDRGGQLFGDVGNDTLLGGDNDDDVFGDDGDDSLDCGASGDLVTGGAGADTIEGGAGQDDIGGGLDNDSLSGGADEDGVFGDEGNDTVNGGSGDDGVGGGDGDDILDGDIGDDGLGGGSGNDALKGAIGNDSLSGGTGNDTIDGGDGGDVANFSGESSEYTITTVNGVTTVVDNIAGRDDLDQLSNVERLVFADKTITIANSPPVAGGDFAVEVLEDSGFTRLFISPPEDPDMDPLEISVTAVPPDSLGAVFLEDGVTAVVAGQTLTSTELAGLQFKPAADASSSPIGSFTCIATDPSGASDSQTITFNVLPVNDAPVAGNDKAFTDEDTPLSVAAPGVLDNDSDIDSPTLAITAVNGVAAGVGQQILLASGALLTVNSDGSYSYDPNGAFDDLADGQTATDSFVYSVGDGDPGGSLSDDAVVTIVITGVSGPTNADTLTGTAGPDSLSGEGGNDSLSGLAGSDVLDGGTGADTMAGGFGADRYIVDNLGDLLIEAPNGGRDLVVSSVSFTLAPNVDNLTLTGSDDLNGTGNGGRNVIIGNDGDNLLDGKGAADNLAGGKGDDTYIVNSQRDIVTEAADAGTDTVRSSASYTLSANVENLVLTGSRAINGTGNDLDNALTGNGHANSLIGGVGADTILGGGGNDTLAGGTGADLFAFSLGSSAGVDLIIDFDRTADILAFSDVVDVGAPGLDLSDVNAAIAGVTDGGLGGNVTVAFNSGARIVFAGAGTGAVNSIDDLVDDPATQIHV